MDLSFTLKVIPAAVIGLTVHECAHAGAAWLMGDSTAKTDGRLSLNPLRHIDPLGFLLLIVAGFGWAKPVVFRRENLRHKHLGEIVIALAGPVSNLALAVVLFVVARVCYATPLFGGTDGGVFTLNLLLLWAIINLGLFVFNLIPLPPLDGSHLYLTFMEELNPSLAQNLYRYGSLTLLAIVLMESLFDWDLLPVGGLVNRIASWLFNTLF